jgi:peptide-methionine (R)-S-oxide reductase
MGTLIRIAITACLLTVGVAAFVRAEVAAPTPGPTAPIPDSELPTTDEGWKARLPAEQYRVLRGHATERACSGAFFDHHQPGVYHCAGCGEPLFESSTKFDSGTGWPSFFAAVPGKVASTADHSLGMERIEVHCARCGGHLGHVFDDGPAPSGKRYCINSAAITFAAAGAATATPALDSKRADAAPTQAWADAVADARASKRIVLIDFTGSDWCPWCVNLDREVFATQRFKDWAARNAVLFTADFPVHAAQSDAVAKENQALREKYHPGDFPVVVAVDADGKELARTGYREGGAEPWIADLEAKLAAAHK